MATHRKKSPKLVWKIVGPLVCILLAVGGALFTIKLQLSHSEPGEWRHTEIKVDSQLPDLTFTRLDGTTTPFSEIRTQVLMLTFWATWCEACMSEMPSIVELRNQYKDKGFEVLGINLDENPEVVAARAAKQLKIEFPIFKDPDGKIAEFFDVRAIPLTVLVNKERKILYIKDGEQNWTSQNFRTLLDRWLLG